MKQETIEEVAENEIKKQATDKKWKFVVWWIPLWNILFVAVFFYGWFEYSDIIAKLMPKANGTPHEEIGMFLGVIPTIITLALTKAIHDKIFEKIINS